MAVVRLRQRDLVWHEVNDSIVCLDIATSRYLNINAAGATLWPLLIDGAGETELVNRLVEHYGIDESRASADVRAFVSMLDQRQLLEHE